MSRLVWGETDKRLYENGVDRGVFYPLGGVGVPWNGLIAVSEAPSGADVIEIYYDGEKSVAQRQRENFSAKISAYTYPLEFEGYDGLVESRTGQRRKSFGFSYRTKVTNDSLGIEYDLIHLVYNAAVTPSDKSYSTIGESVDAITFDWDLETVPEILPSGQTASHLVINTSIAYSWAVEALEDIIYGSAFQDARFPSIVEVLDLFENASIVRITDNGDGTWTADGPDSAVYMISATEFTINWPSAVYIDPETYIISSL